MWNYRCANECDIMNEMTLTIESLAFKGPGVAHLENGKTVFVAGTAPGDIVRAAILEDKKTYCAAELVQLVQEGPARTQPTCPLASVCGGCQWQHVAYEEQLHAKRNAVVSALQRIGGMPAHTAEKCIEPCVGSKRHMGYRNKLELAASHDRSGRVVLGFYEEGTDSIVHPDTCLLAHSAIQRAPQALQGALRYLEGNTDLGIFRVGVRNSMRTHQTEIALWTTPGSFPRTQAVRTLTSALNATSIVRVIATPGAARRVKGVEVLHGAGNWEEELGEFSYRCSAPSFFQVNTAQTEVLQHLVLQGVNVQQGNVVADLYAGVGTFTLPLAASQADVIAVESFGPAVRDLRRNAQHACVDAEVIGGDSGRELPDLGKLDALVVDPPRAGLADSVPASIAEACPARLVYISCDPTTWARDVARLKSCGYHLKSATPIDLFPQTYHVEVVSLFERTLDYHRETT